MGHPLACAGALAVQKKIRDQDLLAKVRRQGGRLIDLLHERFGNHPNVGDIRGRGLFIGVELVADRATKEPLDRKLNMHARVKAKAMQEGLICYPAGGTVDGQSGDHILLAPPFIVSDEDLIELVARLGRAVDGALGEAGV